MRLFEIASNPTTFTTAKGSVYTVNPDGTTKRNKARRPEHGDEEGWQPTSEHTFYMPHQEIVEKLSIFQAEGGPGIMIMEEIPKHPGWYGIKYVTGEYAGKYIKHSLVQPKTKPEIGLCPVEIFNYGHFVHFGNEIVKID